jgi:hypothetical protein
MKFNQQLEQLLKTLSRFTDAEGELLKQNVKSIFIAGTSVAPSPI